MARNVERRVLSCSAPGTTRTLALHRYGSAGARPKAYIQAGIHADEIPALLFAQHLVARLDDFERAGMITGEIVVVPCANPIGLSQWINATHLGRHELGGAMNSNRNWPDPLDAVDDSVVHRLTADPATNVAALRIAMRAGLEQRTPHSELESLQLTLAAAAVDADIVLDVHCDDESLLHLFMLQPLWPDARDLSADLESVATLLEEETGCASFDQAMSSPWQRLAVRHPRVPIPQSCLASTLELRGRGDVSDTLAAKDAAGVVRFLQRRGLLAGDPGPLPAALCTATRLDAVNVVRAPVPGIVSYHVELGQTVAAGQTIADIVNPSAEDPAAARVPVAAATDGMVLSRRQHKYVTSDTNIAKVVGLHRVPESHGFGPQPD